MKITSVNVRKVEKEGSRMKGKASILLDDSFAVHDIRIIEGDNGLFIAMKGNIDEELTTEVLSKINKKYKIIKIEKYRDELGHTRNRYSIL